MARPEICSKQLTRSFRSGVRGRGEDCFDLSQDSGPTNLDLVGGGAQLPGSILEAVVTAHDEAHALSTLRISDEMLVVPR